MSQKLNTYFNKVSHYQDQYVFAGENRVNDELCRR